MIIVELIDKFCILTYLYSHYLYMCNEHHFIYCSNGYLLFLPFPSSLPFPFPSLLPWNSPDYVHQLLLGELGDACAERLYGGQAAGHPHHRGGRHSEAGARQHGSPLQGLRGLHLKLRGHRHSLLQRIMGLWRLVSVYCYHYYCYYGYYCYYYHYYYY